MLNEKDTIIFCFHFVFLFFFNERLNSILFSLNKEENEWVNWEFI